MRDDIDWLNASSDFGMVQLCRDMAALANPLETLTRAPLRKPARPKRPRTPAPRLVSPA